MPLYLNSGDRHMELTFLILKHRENLLARNPDSTTFLQLSEAKLIMVTTEYTRMLKSLYTDTQPNTTE